MKGRSEYAGRFWNLPVVLCCPKNCSFLEYLEMKPALVKFSKVVNFKKFVKFSFQNFIPIYFWKYMVLRRNMFDVFLCVHQTTQYMLFCHIVKTIRNK